MILSRQQFRDLQIIARFLPSVSFTWKKHEMVDQFSALAHLLGCQEKQEKPYRISFVRDPDNGISISLRGDKDLINFIFIDIETFHDTYELLQKDDYYEKIEKVIDEKLRKLEEAVQYLKKVWGEPYFLGDFWDSGFPRDQHEAIRIALWKMIGVHVVLQVEHQDKELPISFNMIITPEQELTSNEFDAMSGYVPPGK